MSFQNFRLDGPPLGPSAPSEYTFPPPLVTAPPPATTAGDATFQIHLEGGPRASTRGPYGSGDMDDGYTLVFESMEAFQQWRTKEEEEKVVEFVKGDTHGSKAVPPRFKEHVKLVCARHCRSGRKKYVKKYPERVRKVPSRKLDGKGCSASISYKTYFDTEEIRVCYISQHSHEIGLANLPFTRKGRRQAAEGSRSTAEHTVEADEPSAAPPVESHVVGPSEQPEPPSSSVRPSPSQQGVPFPSQYPHFPSMSMPAPPGLAPGPVLPMHPAHMPPAERERFERERWERNNLMFQHICNVGRSGFPFSPLTIAALETTLVTLTNELMNPQLQGYLMHVIPPGHTMPPPPGHIPAPPPSTTASVTTTADGVIEQSSPQQEMVSGHDSVLRGQSSEEERDNSPDEDQ